MTENTALLANYADGSGTYSIYVHDETLITDINDGSEVLLQRLTRAPEFDTWDWADWMLAERIGTTPDLGEHGAALIDGLAYLLDEPTSGGRLDVVAAAMQAFSAETFGLVYRGPKAVVVVTADGHELLVGFYDGPDGYQGDEPDDGLIIPAEALDAEVEGAIRPFLRDAGRPAELAALDAVADSTPIDIDAPKGFDAYDAAAAERDALAKRLGFYFPHPPIAEDVLNADYSGRCEGL